MYIIEGIEKAFKKVDGFVKGRKERSRELIKRAKGGDKTAKDILKKEYHLEILSPEEYYQRREEEKIWKEAKKGNFPFDFLRGLSKEVRKKIVINLKWEDIEKEFEKLNTPEFVLLGFEKLNLIEKYTREGVDKIIEYILSRDDLDLLVEKIVRVIVVINPWGRKWLKKIKEEKKYWKNRISSLTRPELISLYKKLFWNVNLYRIFPQLTIKRLKMEWFELRKVICRRYFAQKVIQGKFIKRKTKFPKIEVEVKRRWVKKAGKLFPEKRFYVGKKGRKAVEGLIPGIPTASNFKVTVMPYLYFPYYGWIFRIENEGYFYIVGNKNGRMYRLTKLSIPKIIKDYKERGFPPLPVQFVEMSKIVVGRRIFIAKICGKKFQIPVSSEMRGKEVKVKLKPTKKKKYKIIISSENLSFSVIL